MACTAGLARRCGRVLRRHASQMARPSPPAPLTPGAAPSASSGPPNYLAQALHRELAMLGSAESPDASAIMGTFMKYCDLSQPQLADIDACLNALVKSDLAGKAINAVQFLRLLDLLEANLFHDRDGRPRPGASRELSHVAWALTRLQQARAALPPEMLARLPALFAGIQAAARPLLLAADFEPRYLALLGWALAKGGVGSPGFYRELGDAALPRMHQLAPQDWSGLAWAFGTVSADHPLMDGLAKTLNERKDFLSTCGEQEVSSIIWAFATLKKKSSSPALLESTAAEVKLRTHEFSVQSLVNITWGFATLRARPAFLPEVLEQIQGNLGWRELGPRGSARLLWSLATARRSDQSELFYFLLADRVILPLASEFQAQDVSNVLWAFATARVRHDPVFKALAARSHEIIAHFVPQALVNVAWACAKMRAQAPQLLEAAAAETVRRDLRAWTPQGLVTLCWSCAEYGYREIQLLEATIQELSRRPKTFNDVDLATLVAVLAPESGWSSSFDATRRTALELIAHQAKAIRLPFTREALRQAGVPQP